MEQHEHLRKDIEGYVRSQFRETDIEIDHLELINEQWVGSELFRVWDCHIEERERWWAITPFTNIYKQEGEFKSADFTLTFHIGIRERVLWRSDGPPPVREGYEALDSVFREMDQADDLAHQVVEVQDARNAGVALRETLISFVGALRGLRPELVGEKADLRDGDFVGWADVIASHITEGRRKRKLRKYLKTLAAPTWQYANWLAHDSGGTKEEALTALEMSRHLISVYLSAFFNNEKEAPEECPSCKSRRLSWDNDYYEDGNETTQLCEACGWRSETIWNPYHTDEGPPISRED